jgi:chromosome segregation ATPase
MKKFFKVVFVVGLCGVATVALAHVVLGKHRTHDAAKALQHMAQSEVDELIRQQSDLKEELSRLRTEYPKQIAMLRSQQAQVDRQLEGLAKEETRATDIVRLCEEDISYLEDQRETVGNVYADTRAIEHRGSKYNASEAEQLIGRIAETRGIYVTRLDDINAERAVLEGEKDQIAIELAAVEAEQAEFEAEYQSLLREIERLKRNEELLKVAEGRRGMGCERHSEAMSTLTDVKSAVERARMEQEERLKSARVAPRSLDYETRARLLELERNREAKAPSEEETEVAVGNPEVR